MKFRIDRSKWVCGNECSGHYHGEGDTAMLNRFGYMCCLGQVAIQLGVGARQLLDAATPEDVPIEHRDPLYDLLVRRADTWQYVEKNTDLADTAMGFNDDGRLTNECREWKLISLFAESGHELEFYGDFNKEHLA